MKRLFQECKIAKGNATVLSEMLAFAKPEQMDRSVIPVRDFSCLQSPIPFCLPYFSLGTLFQPHFLFFFHI